MSHPLSSPAENSLNTIKEISIKPGNNIRLRTYI